MYMRRRRGKKVNYAKKSIQQLRDILFETQSSLQETINLQEKSKIEYEVNLRKKRQHDELVEECNRIRANAHNRRNMIAKIFSNSTNPPLSQDETNRLLELNKRIGLTNYKYIPNPYHTIQRVLNYQQTLRDRIDQLTNLIEKKEELEAKAANKKEILKVKRSKERGIIASAQGKTRQAANALKNTLRKQIKEYPNCPYCDEPLGVNPHCDHIHPVSHGGLSTVENMVYICSSCNIKKRDLTLREFIIQNGLNRGHVEKGLIAMGKRI